MNFDAILLTSFGGPESPEEVMPFLERVTAGRQIPRERLIDVSHHYLSLGGVSPINKQNRELYAALQLELQRRKIDIPLYLGNRNSQPFFPEVLSQMHSDGHSRVLSLVTSAYSSYSGCRQYRENLAQALIETELSNKMTIEKVRAYFDHPGFIGPFAQGTATALQTLFTEGLKSTEIHIFFTTHSIPITMAQSCGPASIREKYDEGVYVTQHNQAIDAILKEVGQQLTEPMPAFSLVYQSRSGAPHIPWLEPDIGDALRAIDPSEIKAVVLVPIGFVSDHIEVIWDLDNEAKEIAEEQKLRFIRVATPGKSSKFVSGLVDLIAERLEGEAEIKALSSMGPWPDTCTADCCPNPRGTMPTVAEEVNA